jgi:hypothetical protein
MARLKAWVKKYLQKHPKEQLQLLSTSRRPVTPTVFDIPTSPFFQLPYDIRSLIVLMAFGNRDLHVDLELGERGWRWRGALCDSGSRNPSEGPFKGHPYGDLWRDQCVSVSRRNGGHYNPGVTGFLLSCRQAYAEGIHVIWSTNITLISSEPLLHLPSLIAPARLSSLTSLEIRLNPRPIQPNNGSSGMLDHLQPILSNIEKHCPQLLSFVLSFYLAKVTEHIASGPALPSIDAFYRSMRLRYMRVEVPYITLSNLKRNRLPYQQHPHEKPADGRRMRITSWRALDGDEPRVEERSYERYPGPPLRLPRSENEDMFLESKGYWLVMGEEIWTPQYACECGNRP